ncbi:VanW family protein [Desulfosporosinus sp. PR]|uniref:VanW family protein n=1 Tax=Candidatus Desulfosporosinus nitrosoreducens TaxID=3401928 RepID=UPI0027F1324A|nr:VanW family protein [Desulfosporosinus sp. PR]MDQ7095161.1 VanW family protein [Desulfosporosinus sp. PR]
MRPRGKFHSARPRTRSNLRMFLGKLYFTFLRHIQWRCKRLKPYATGNQAEELPVLVTSHKTPLYRQLRNVEMWLQENKVNNLKLACEKLNGILLNPGETFSFWRIVGKPTKRKGFKRGMILINGGFSDGIGGGLCQLSNLIYWLTLHTPLTVTERWRHTHDVFPDSKRTQPFGSGATVVYNYVDLQIQNDTQQVYQLKVKVGDQELEGEWRSTQPYPFKYKVYESEHSISHEWWGGYMRHNVIKRKMFDQKDCEISDDFITENHAIMMYEPLLEKVK